MYTQSLNLQKNWLFDMYQKGYSGPQIVSILKNSGLSDAELAKYYKASLSLAYEDGLGDPDGLGGFFKRLGSSIKKIVKHPKKAIRRVFRKPGDFLMTAGIITGGYFGGRALLSAIAKRKATSAIVTAAKQTPVSQTAIAKAPIISGVVEKIMPYAKEAVPIVTPMIVEKLQAKGIYPETATEEDIRDVMNESVSSTQGFFGLPWYIPVAGAGLLAFLLMRRH